MEALGAAGSLVGIAAIGAQLTRILARYVGEVRFAAESFEAVVDEIDTISAALNTVCQLLHIHERKKKAGHHRDAGSGLFSAKALSDIRDTSGRCLLVFWRIEACLKRQDEDPDLNRKLKVRLHRFQDDVAKGNEVGVDIKLCGVALDREMGHWEKLKWPFLQRKIERYCEKLKGLHVHLTLITVVAKIHAESSHRCVAHSCIILTMRVMSGVLTASPWTASRTKRFRT
jgi:hypothetical protein